MTATTGCVEWNQVTLSQWIPAGTNTIALTGAASFDSTCIILSSEGCFYDGPNSLALGGGTYTVKDLSGTLLSHGSFRIANTAGTTEGLEFALFSPTLWPYDTGPCSASVVREVRFTATFIDADTKISTSGGVGAAISPTGVGAVALLPYDVQYFGGFVDGVTVSC